MIDADLVRTARDMPIERLAERHGLKLRRAGAERVGPCPRCGGTDRFGVNIAKGLFNCRGCGAKGDSLALEMHITGCTFGEAVSRLTGGAWRPANPLRYFDTPEALNRRHAASVAERTAAALVLWNAATDPRGTPTERYLNTRGLDLDVGGEVLRWHGGIGAMLALFRDIRTDEPRAVSRTFLDANARKIERRFFGPVGGCAIKLDPDDVVLGSLHIGEGVETCMAARQLGFRPSWALGSSGAVATFPVLSGVETLLLLREHDDANARAATACGTLWFHAGRKVFDVRPDVGKDINDEVMMMRGAP